MARPINCDLLLPAAVDAVSNDCAVLTKQRNILISKGQCGVVQWQLRFKDGVAADFSACVDSDSDVTVKVRFQGCDMGFPIAEVEGEIVDAAQGQIKFQLPTNVCTQAGIYFFTAGVFVDGALAFDDRGMTSVEPSAWTNIMQTLGPPTIQEIRLHLRDFPESNDLLGTYEFDDTEILDAIRWPIMDFNERPPQISNFNCATFPFRYNWRNAIIGELLRTAAHHYVRNKMQTEGAGLSVDDKNKNDDYLKIAKMYRDEWVEFVTRTKTAKNMQDFIGTLSGWGSFNGW